MSDQKPKIDLKARLGKKPASSPLAGGSSIPPGMAPGAVPGMSPGGVQPAAARPSMQRPGAQPYGGGVPTGGIPAPSVGSGIPAPPFGGSRPAGARMDPSNPYGAMEVPAAAPSRPQAIRVEIGEEVVEAQRRGRKKVMVLSLITALVGGFVGFTIGGGSERAKGAASAVTGAQDLVGEIDKANAEVQKLADTLKAAKEKLGKGEYPEAEVSQLGAINIPFTGKNLAGKGIGRFKPELISMLIEYANTTTSANEQKEKLQNVLTGAKKGLQELLEQKEKPQVRWSVLVGNGPGGPWAAMQPIPTPFPARERWPEEIKVGSGKQEASFRRFTSGNPVNDQSPFFLPVDPTTQTSVCPADTIFKLRRELNDLETILRGDTTPGADRPGLVDSARALTERLKQIGRES